MLFFLQNDYSLLKMAYYCKKRLSTEPVQIGTWNRSDITNCSANTFPFQGLLVVGLSWNNFCIVSLSLMAHFRACLKSGHKQCVVWLLASNHYSCYLPFLSPFGGSQSKNTRYKIVVSKRSDEGYAHSESTFFDMFSAIMPNPSKQGVT